MATLKSYKASLSNGERISSVDQILNALEEVKVRLPFFLIHPVQRAWVQGRVIIKIYGDSYTCMVHKCLSALPKEV